MINLRVKDYCECCGKFEPVVERHVDTYFTGLDNEPCCTIYDTTVRCGFEETCSLLFDAMRNEIKRNNAAGKILEELNREYSTEVRDE